MYELATTWYNSVVLPLGHRIVFIDLISIGIYTITLSINRNKSRTLQTPEH
jgi:hypothetical protein